MRIQRPRIIALTVSILFISTVSLAQYMHVHLFPGAGQPDDLANQQLQLFLANGVTTIRNMEAPLY